MQNQDLRIRKTYAALTQAFQTLLVQKEFIKISVNELCELAMIRRPTFYKHFLDKYDFLNFFIKHKIEEIFSKALING
ncbi:TetR/AcrR family transcriptional regulator, partial [Coprococcus eutactus]|nr:TetR/AcrR family transcriptional regulator [Coprococcus eutactus]